MSSSKPRRSIPSYNSSSSAAPANLTNSLSTPAKNSLPPNNFMQNPSNPANSEALSSNITKSLASSASVPQFSTPNRFQYFNQPPSSYIDHRVPGQSTANSANYPLSKGKRPTSSVNKANSALSPLSSAQKPQKQKFSSPPADTNATIDATQRFLLKQSSYGEETGLSSTNSAQYKSVAAPRDHHSTPNEQYIENLLARINAIDSQVNKSRAALGGSPEAHNSTASPHNSSPNLSRQPSARTLLPLNSPPLPASFSNSTGNTEKKPKNSKSSQLQLQPMNNPGSALQNANSTVSLSPFALPSAENSAPRRLLSPNFYNRSVNNYGKTPLKQRTITESIAELFLHTNSLNLGPNSLENSESSANFNVSDYLIKAFGPEIFISSANSAQSSLSTGPELPKFKFHSNFAVELEECYVPSLPTVINNSLVADILALHPFLSKTQGKEQQPDAEKAPSSPENPRIFDYSVFTPDLEAFSAPFARNYAFSSSSAALYSPLLEGNGEDNGEFNAWQALIKDNRPHPTPAQPKLSILTKYSGQNSNNSANSAGNQGNQAEKLAEINNSIGRLYISPRPSTMVMKIDGQMAAAGIKSVKSQGNQGEKHNFSANYAGSGTSFTQQIQNHANLATSYPLQPSLSANQANLAYPGLNLGQNQPVSPNKPLTALESLQLPGNQGNFADSNALLLQQQQQMMLSAQFQQQQQQFLPNNNEILLKQLISLVSAQNQQRNRSRSPSSGHSSASPGSSRSHSPSNSADYYSEEEKINYSARSGRRTKKFHRNRGRQGHAEQNERPGHQPQVNSSAGAAVNALNNYEEAERKIAPRIQHAQEAKIAPSTQLIAQNNGQNSGAQSQGNNGQSQGHFELTAAQRKDLFTKCRNNRHEAVEELLASGVAVNTADQHGNQCIHIACQNGNKRMVKICLRYGADINATNLQGNTPLHYLFAYNYDSLAAYLISKNANDAKLNYFGYSCYDGLRPENKEEALTLLHKNLQYLPAGVSEAAVRATLGD
jgi:hypothetical protein